MVGDLSGRSGLGSSRNADTIEALVVSFQMQGFREWARSVRPRVSRRILIAGRYGQFRRLRLWRLRRRTHSARGATTPAATLISVDSTVGNISNKSASGVSGVVLRFSVPNGQALAAGTQATFHVSITEQNNDSWDLVISNSDNLAGAPSAGKQISAGGTKNFWDKTFTLTIPTKIAEGAALTLGFGSGPTGNDKYQWSH